MQRLSPSRIIDNHLVSGTLAAFVSGKGDCVALATHVLGVPPLAPRRPQHVQHSRLVSGKGDCVQHQQTKAGLCIFDSPPRVLAFAAAEPEDIKIELASYNRWPWIRGTFPAILLNRSWRSSVILLSSAFFTFTSNK